MEYKENDIVFFTDYVGDDLIGKVDKKGYVKGTHQTEFHIKSWLWVKNSKWSGNFNSSFTSVNNLRQATEEERAHFLSCEQAGKFVEKGSTKTVSKNGWYCHDNNRHPEWLMYHDFGTGKSWGITGNDWRIRTRHEGENYIKNYNLEIASEEKVLRMLTEQAKARELVYGCDYRSPYHEGINIQREAYGIDSGDFVENDDGFSEGNYLLYEGKWATVHKKTQIKQSPPKAVTITTQSDLGTAPLFKIKERRSVIK